MSPFVHHLHHMLEHSWFLSGLAWQIHFQQEALEVVGTKLLQQKRLAVSLDKAIHETYLKHNSPILLLGQECFHQGMWLIIQLLSGHLQISFPVGTRK